MTKAWYGTVLVREKYQQRSTSRAIKSIPYGESQPESQRSNHTTVQYSYGTAVTTDRYRATESGERTDNANGKIQDRYNPCDGHTNDKRRTHGEKFVKSGERTDKANGQIQDPSRMFNGSIVSPPTHPKTNNLRLYSTRGSWYEYEYRLYSYRCTAV